MPSPKSGESQRDFVSRCMSDPKSKETFPENEQRLAFCYSQFNSDGDGDYMFDNKDKYMQAADQFCNTIGYTEDITAENFVVPEDSDYVDFGEETEEWDIAEAKPGLWDNIRKKKEREGKKYKPAKPGDPDRPDPESWKKAQKPTGKGYMYKDMSHDAGPMEKYVFDSEEKAIKMAKEMGLKPFAHPHKTGDGKTIYMPGKNMKEFSDWYEKHSPKKSKEAKGDYKYEHPKTGEIFTYVRRGVYKKDGVTLRYKGKAAEYQGRKVTLNKPFRTPDGPKKFSVYVKNQKGNVIKVNFGDPNMEIKRDNPARRKSFRARHKCDTAKDKTTPRYWSCKMW